MVSGAVTNRYTEGLYRAAVAAGNVDQVEQGLLTISSAVSAHADLKGALEHPLIDAKAKVSILRGVFGDSIHDIVYQFLQVLFGRDRSGYIVAVANAFHSKVEGEHGRVQVLVESAQPLNPEELESLKAKLQTATGKQVDADASVNPTLIAGYRIRMGNRVLDATVRAAIDQFSDHLLAAGATQATASQ